MSEANKEKGQPLRDDQIRAHTEAGIVLNLLSGGGYSLETRADG